MGRGEHGVRTYNVRPHPAPPLPVLTIPPHLLRHGRWWERVEEWEMVGEWWERVEEGRQRFVQTFCCSNSAVCDTISTQHAQES